MVRYVCNVIIFMTCFISFGQFAPIPSFFNIQRELPLVDLNTTATVSVADYGAIVDDGNDDIAAITAAINAAKSLATDQNPVRLLFESGTYDLMPDGSTTHSLLMTDAKSILWDGQNAQFLIHDPAVGFLNLLRCTNVIVKDISVDYATLPFTQGKITLVDKVNGYFEFSVDPNFPPPTASYFGSANQNWGMIKNTKGGIKPGASNLIPYTGFTSVSGNTYRSLQGSRYLNAMEVGDYFVQIARNNGKTLFYTNVGKNVTYLNVTGYASPAGGFNANNSEEWNIINSHIKIKSGRVHSINADCIHVSSGTIAPWVENSSFEGFSDDCVNLKYTKRTITAINSPTQITVLHSVAVGENLEFYNPRDGIFLGSATVTAVQNLGSNLFKITLSNAINITTITNPEHQLADKAYIESRSNQSFIFRNNVVKNSRRYGILLQSKYALIENNVFQNLSSSGIRIENGVDWGEGFRASDVVIQNNTFENCGFDKTYIDEAQSAAITVDFMKLGSPCTEAYTWCGTQTADWQAHSNITISNNTILYNKRGLYLKNINGLTLDNNYICQSGQDITLGTGQSPTPFTILNCSNVVNQPYNYGIPSANFHFELNEDTANASIVNSGTDTSVDLKINASGGTITQGYYDNDLGYSVSVNTDGNGNLRFVNKDSGTAFPGPIQGAERSYTFWIKPQEAIFQTLLFSGGPTVGEVFAVQMLANGVLRVTDNNQNTVLMQDMPLDIGIWNHVAITVPEGNTMRSISLYKNGVPSKESFTGTDAFINTASSTVNFFPKFKGIIKDIRYFDFTLCNGEVESVFSDQQTTLSVPTDLMTNSQKIIVYPTITSELINFNKPVSSVKVFNLLGEEVLSKEQVNITKLNIASLSPGFYILKLNKIQTAKIFKR